VRPTPKSQSGRTSGAGAANARSNIGLRTLTWCAVGILALFGATACKSKNAGVIAFVPRTTGMSLWESAHAGAEAAADAAQLRTYWNAPTREDDIKSQIALVNRVIDSGYAGLILSPDQPLALLTPVRRGLAQGIPTVVLGSPLAMPPGGRLSYILNDEEEAGRLAAMRIGELLHGKGSIVILGINFEIIGVVDRVRSFESVLKDKFPQISIVEKRTGSFNVPYEQQSAEEVLMAHPEVNAVVAVTADATRGSYAALDELHRLGTTRLVGFDQDLMLPVATGTLDSVVIEDTYDMGYRAVELLAAEIQGKPVPQLIRIRPRLVTKENLGSPEIRRILALDSGWVQ
jgi:ribose transport system substrate-binding protein